MNESFSQHLLLAIVHGLRAACRSHIKNENFIVVSGFLSFDVDSKSQHRFIINELINKDDSGEGHSTFMKVIDWRYLAGRLSLHPMARQNKINQPASFHRALPGGQTRGLHGKIGLPQKCLMNKPSCRTNFFNRHKSTNQTFTLEDLQLPPHTPKRDNQVARNFSSATISISNQNSVYGPVVEPSKRGLPQSPKVSSCHKICHSKNSSMSSSVKEGVGKKSGSESSDISHSKQSLPDQHAVRPARLQVAAESSINVLETKSRRFEVKQQPRAQHNSKFSAPSVGRAASAHGKTVLSSLHNNKESVQHASLLTRGCDSEINIDSIRPKYLVKHNNELLIPCPHLSSKYNSQLASTKNNNRLENESPLGHTTTENVPRFSHISALLSSIIGAFSYSTSLADEADTSSNVCTPSIDKMNVEATESSDCFSPADFELPQNVGDVIIDELQPCLSGYAAAVRWTPERNTRAEAAPSQQTSHR